MPFDANPSTCLMISKGGSLFPGIQRTHVRGGEEVKAGGKEEGMRGRREGGKIGERARARERERERESERERERERSLILKDKALNRSLVSQSVLAKTTAHMYKV